MNVLGPRERKSLQGEGSRFVSAMHVFIQRATRGGSKLRVDPGGKGKFCDCVMAFMIVLPEM